MGHCRLFNQILGGFVEKSSLLLVFKNEKFGIQQLRILILMPSYFIFDSSIFWYKVLVGFPKTLSIPIKTLYLECKTHGPIENVCTQIILPKYMLCTVPTYVLLVGGGSQKEAGQVFHHVVTTIKNVSSIHCYKFGRSANSIFFINRW